VASLPIGAMIVIVVPSVAMAASTSTSAATCDNLLGV